MNKSCQNGGAFETPNKSTPKKPKMTKRAEVREKIVKLKHIDKNNEPKSNDNVQKLFSSSLSNKKGFTLIFGNN